MKTIIAEDLYKSYNKGSVKALDGLNLDVEEGTVLGVLGPNGAGKTTTVRVLATLLTPDSGRATVAGIDVLKNPDEVRKIIGLSGQYAAVDETLTGWDNLIMFGRLYHLSAKQ
ncbi:MAG: ATP-binding cassette domain-containing protein, partial [Candidatus Nanopelagicus sp.]